jgi:hypothetical protein
MKWQSRRVVAIAGVVFLLFVARTRWASESATALSAAAEPKTRSSAIRETMDVIRAECQRSASGDWDRWTAQLEPVRSDLVGKMRVAKAYNPSAAGYFEARSPVLEGKDQFPLFESAPEHYLLHVVEPGALDLFRLARPVVAGDRWLERQGIDVLFVPVPKMTEVYPEYFTDHCPSNRIIAPQVRRSMLEMLEADVEVVDLWYAFQAERDKDPEPLYQPADPHWGPRAQAIAARVVAERLKRYDFVVKAQAAPSICEGPELPFAAASAGATFQALTPEQRRRAEQNQPHSSRIPQKFRRPQFDDSALVACIGDSYNFGFMELLAREINLPIRALPAGGHTSDVFKDCIRNPVLLEGCKVVIWLVCNSSLKNPWPLPKGIADAGESHGVK